jgi:hypothetical protein
MVKLSAAAVRRISLSILALSLAGCASMASTPEQAVRDRANGHWRARLANDLEASYGFLPPSYRALTPLQKYKASFGNAAQLTAAQVVGVKCETQDKCVATSRIEAKAAPLMRGNVPPIVTHYEETWVRESGQWWLFPA